ncbi:rcc01693 family protein [Rhizobium oryzicola]|uniref:Phage tail assembly chaperone n=1 Tax=Rhizobium oryzicola TaxID=1232668 RepID=A0ABT8ST19_9HYPH|nr:rcc01693 family protein [Rhizobium oryzicola]MDO1581565.1 phage tail assembly chaperone [Rhizobium oryzicola]
MTAAAGRVEPSGFPWPLILHAGLCLLRLPPHQFWQMTLTELSALCGGFKPRAQGFDRAAFAALMAAFPDG